MQPQLLQRGQHFRNNLNISTDFTVRSTCFSLWRSGPSGWPFATVRALSLFQLRASLLICVTLPTSGLPICHNLSHYILRLHCLAPLQVHPNIGSVLDHPPRPNKSNAKSHFYPLDATLCQILTGSSVCLCLAYPLFNWLGFHSVVEPQGSSFSLLQHDLISSANLQQQ